ncbi:MAG: 2-amino-4-hydroxy-6-hydroxymethyldihydropteridine diphosphokinase [Bacteroidales bacterium]|jgi:2-amino-4-hydroxy-6-hydroxymethyldihydropteridine diphosphokinase|nr:2-amino-4-hydroxy-6-hydroxymethyldihydropteridine diphosphokinase [Bacteroidales bacterium]
MKVFLGIGGNLGDRKKNIEDAIFFISEKISIPLKISSNYLSEPWGFQHKKYFLNAVVVIETDLYPDKILEKISDIETIMKRIREKNSYEGRTIDIDILFVDNKIINSENLQIPHPKLHERLFVLTPLNEIFPDFIHPVFNKKISELLDLCEDKSNIRRIQNKI